MIKLQSLLITFIFSFFLSSCISESNSLKDGNAPRNIQGYVFAIKSDKVNSEDEAFKGTLSYYYFYNDDTYKLMLKGKKHGVGMFSYKKTSPNEADVILSYVYKSVEMSYTIKFTFLTPNSGNWSISYQGDVEDDEAGTFKIET